MTKVISKSCKCGCKTVLFWYEKKACLGKHIKTSIMEQKTFCPNEKTEK